MKINVFKKKVTTNNGKVFWKFVTNLSKNNGDTVYADVMFRDGIITSDMEFPKTFIIDKKDANLSTSNYTTKEGKDGKSYKLWVNKVQDIEEYIDTSLDDFI